MPKKDINGFQAHYLTRGEGPDVILIHGLSGDLASWHPVVVARLAERHRVTMIDLKGHGRSGMPASGYTTRDLAGDLASLMDQIGIPRAHLVGHSFGGAIALHAAVLFPDRVSGLVVADSRIRGLQETSGVQQWAHWDRVRDWLGRHGIDLPERMADPDLGLLRCLAEHRVAGRLEGLAAEPFFIPFSRGSVRRAEQWLRLIESTTAATDYKEVAGLTADVIRHVASPALAIYGGLSHCLPTREILVDLMPDCTAETIQGVGHFHPIAAPKAFADHVEPFLRRVTYRESEASASRPAPRPAARPPHVRPGAAEA